MKRKYVTVKGVISRIYYNENGFVTGVLERHEPSEAVKFAGEMLAEEGREVELEGEWDVHPKYGKQFKIRRPLTYSPASTAGLVMWLERCEDARGIGPVKASSLMRRFGKDLPTVLTEQPAAIAEVANIPLADAEALATAWRGHENQIRTISCLLAMGLKMNQASAVYNEWGGESVETISRNPYCMTEIEGIGFETADSVALIRGLPEDSSERIRAGLLYVLDSRGFGNGSTCLNASQLIESAAKCLNLTAHAELVSKTVLELESAGQLIDVQGRMTSQFRLLCEDELSKWLAALNRPNDHIDPDQVDSLARVHYGQGLDWDQGQFEAVRLALENQGCVITGGAGAGKSTILRAVANAFAACGLDVTLAAPTGNAARRMEERTGRPASTIHKLLGYQGNKWNHDRSNPLCTDAILIDEMSMMDAELAWRLFQSLPEHCCVVLVGDHHQLPPVSPGAVLRDCVEHNLLPVARLGHVHRMAGPLLFNCNYVLAGQCPRAKAIELCGDGQPKPGGKPVWIVGDTYDGEEKLADAVESIFDTFVAEKFGLDPVTEFQIIAPMKRGPIGTWELNKRIQKVRQRKLGRTVSPTKSERGKLMQDDRVMQLRNNYKLGTPDKPVSIMNGTQGVVVCESPLSVLFDGLNRPLRIPNDRTGDLELAYAVTIHKFQGSEAPAVLVVCHHAHYVMLNRCLLYTATTRAQRHLMIIGDDRGINQALRTVKDDARQTLLPLLKKTLAIDT